MTMKRGVAEVQAVAPAVARAVWPAGGERRRKMGAAGRSVRTWVRGAAEAGEGMFRAFVWLGILLLFCYICWLIVPVYMANYQFQDAMRTEAHFAVFEHKDQEQVRASIFRAAGDLGLPVRSDEIIVEPIQGGYRITVHYAVPLRIFRHEFLLHLSPTADSNSV
jgi:hypothetical protein